MGRFFFHPDPQPGKVILLPPEEAHHLEVQRIAPQKDILVGDGKGKLYRGILQGREREGAFVLVVEKVREEDPPYPLFIWQSFLKSPTRMDWLVEKLAEIGVTKIGLFPAERSVRERISEEKMQRLQRIVINACKQSGRVWFPVVQVFTSWEEFLSTLSAAKGGTLFLADPSGEENLLRTLKKGDIRCLLGLIIGPEGDLTEKEKGDLSALGARPVSLGRKILRSETAALVGAALLSSFLEEKLCG